MPVVHVVDDDLSARRALVRLMRSAGFDSFAYSGVDELLRSNLDGKRVCVLADVHMPGTSALTLPALLREHGLDIPVIFLTGDYSDITREKVRQIGGSGYFQKPVDDQNLVDMIHWAMTSKQTPVTA